MKVIIIEDENLAARQLSEQIKRIDNDITVEVMLDSVSSAVKWFNENEQPDLAFFDIQLGDGLSFEIFEQTRVKCPVIFTTAFDEYALQAFKVNSVDYILKPLDVDELKQALDKFKQNWQKEVKPDTTVYEKVYKMLSNDYKSRFLIKVGEHLKTFPVEKINLFFSMDKSSFLKADSGKDYAIDYSLEQLEHLVNPELFFRVNRKFLVNLNAITDIISYSNSRLKIITTHATDEEIIVSRDKVKEFKSWLDR